MPWENRGILLYVCVESGGGGGCTGDASSVTKLCLEQTMAASASRPV